MATFRPNSTANVYRETRGIERVWTYVLYGPFGPLYDMCLGKSIQPKWASCRQVPTIRTWRMYNLARKSQDMTNSQRHKSKAAPSLPIKQPTYTVANVFHYKTTKVLPSVIKVLKRFFTHVPRQNVRWKIKMSKVHRTCEATRRFEPGSIYDIFLVLFVYSTGTVWEK